MGGLSPEREVSLASGSAVLEAVKRKGLSGVGIDVSNDIAFALEKNKQRDLKTENSNPRHRNSYC